MKKTLLVLMALMATALWVSPGLAADVQGVNIHGFISQGYLYTDGYNYLANDTKDGSFEYNEAGINFSKPLTDKLRIGLQLFSRDLGDVANNKVTVDWAYGDYRWKDWLGLRAGRIKLPLGLYNETRDMDMLRTSIVLPQGIYNDLLRDNLIALNGVSLYGYVGIGVVGAFEYKLLAGAGNSDNDSGSGKYTNSRLGGAGVVNGNTTSDTAFSGAIQWHTPINGLKLGYSILNVPKVTIPILFGGALQATSDAFATYQIASAEYTWNDLTVAAEYFNLRGGGSMILADGTVLSPETISTGESYYLSASYRFTDLFSLGAYYSIYYPDVDNKDGEGEAIKQNYWEKDLALTLRFDINDYWVFKVEGHSVDGTANVLTIDNAGNDFSKRNWYYGAAKITFNF